MERALSVVGRRTRSLVYVSLLANPACPDMLSSLDVDEHDYARYRQVSNYFTRFVYTIINFARLSVVSVTVAAALAGWTAGR